MILEELDEFWDEVKRQGGSGVDQLRELIQVAAMCQRTAEDTELVERFAQFVKPFHEQEAPS